jgi:hypothetical protein
MVVIAKRFVMPEFFPDKSIRGHAYRASIIPGSYNPYSRSAHPKPVEGRGNDIFGSFAITPAFNQN